MSPTITGNATAAVHHHGHVSLRTRREATDVDPYEALEAARARKAIRSPIKPPEGGWTGPEPAPPAAETPKRKKPRPRTPKAKPAPKPKPRKSEPTPEQVAEQVNAATTTVRRVLTRRGVTLTDGRGKYSGGGNSLTRRGDVDPQHVADLYAQHGNARTVASIVGTSGQTVTRILHSLDVPVRPSPDVQKGRPGSDRAAALKALMHAHGITSADVRAWARQNGHPIADRGIPTRAVIDAYLAAKEATA